MATLKFLAKVASIPHYSISDIFVDIPISSHIKNKVMSFNETLMSFLSIYNLKIHYSVPNLYPPWNFVFSHVDFTFKKIEISKRPIASSLFENYLKSTYSDYLLIYTDASKNDNHNVGIAICIPQLNSYSVYRLSDYISVFAAEFIAIKFALNIASAYDSEKVLIITDSLNALNDIYFGSSRLYPEILNDILYFLKYNDRFFSFCYIPGHIGFEAHDKTDYLAKKASSLPVINFTLNNKFHEVYNIIDRHFLNEWLTNFQQCTTGQQYLKYFHPPYNLINLNFNGNRHKETIFNRLRLQNCKNNYYLFKIGASISPLCDLCLQTDTVEHFLTECFKHSSMHSELKLSCKNIKKPFNVHSVLSNITLYNIIYRYIVKNKLQFKF